MDIDSDNSGSETTASSVCLPGQVDPIGDLSATLKWVYDTGESADLTVILGDKRAKLHKAVVVGQSPVFRRAVLDGEDEIKPGTWSFEKDTQTYEAVFRFMYGLKYDDNLDVSCIRFHAAVWRLALCFGVLKLRKLAFKNLRKRAKTAWDADEFLKVLEMEIFELREYFISTCREHIHDLLTKPEFEIILSRDSELARELTKMLGKSLRSFGCPLCKESWALDCSVLSSPSFCPNCGHYEMLWDQFVK